jgi:hypothetical protein
MQGRRRETRFLMSPPWAGALHTLEDVIVERIAESDIWVLSSTPANRDDGLIFEMSNNGYASGVKVRVTESRPVVVDDRLQHRLRLQVINGTAADTRRGNGPN